MAEPFNPDKFLVTFPLWSLIHPVAGGEDIIAIPGPNGEKAAPLFTDRDLVGRFRTSDPGRRRFMRAVVKDPARLLAMLDIVEKRGFTHVALDPAGGSAAYYPLAQVRAFAERVQPRPPHPNPPTEG